MIERGNSILAACREQTGTNPILIFQSIARQDYIRIHGPEHHILDGACILTAYYNAGGKIDLEAGLKWILEQGMKMPGAACGHWGVCGAVTSVGAALAFIDGTGPLSTDGTWGKHMAYTSKVIARMGQINGPRCCKRDGFLALETAVDFINDNYPVHLDKTPIHCGFYPKNQQCIASRCPFFPG